MLTRNRERDPSVTVRKESNTVTWFGCDLQNSRRGMMPFSVWVQDVHVRKAGRTPVSLKRQLSATFVQIPNLSETFQGLFLFSNSRRISRKLCFQGLWSLAVTLEVSVVSVLLRLLPPGQWAVSSCEASPLEWYPAPVTAPQQCWESQQVGVGVRESRSPRE